MNNPQPQRLELAIWQSLNDGVWPEALAQIKPNRWDSSNLSAKGKLVLEHFGQIIYHTTLITNRMMKSPRTADPMHDKSHLYP